ncbi:hypothetical protein QQM79_20855 [Marinobacteraceae bacterium S3BR75-40.1]
MPGFPLHIVQRGHHYYLANLEEWKHALGLKLYSYCLMTNHVHLVVEAGDELAAIPGLMKRLAGRQRIKWTPTLKALSVLTIGMGVHLKP